MTPGTEGVGRHSQAPVGPGPPYPVSLVLAGQPLGGVRVKGSICKLRCATSR